MGHLKLFVLISFLLLMGCSVNNSNHAVTINTKPLPQAELKNQLLLEEFQMDLNRDGGVDQVRMVTSHYDENPVFFSAPIYLEYRTNKEEPFQRLALDVPPIDLTKGNVKIRTGDLDSNQVDEILYSIDYPLPEYVTRWPHILHYRGEKFVDMDITETYEFIVEDWDVTLSEQGLAQLTLHEKVSAFGESTKRQYRLDHDGELIPHP